MALNLGQQKGLAKFLYDVAKLVFAILVLGPLAKPDLGSWPVIVGAMCGTVFCVGAALLLEEGQAGGDHQHES